MNAYVPFVERVRDALYRNRSRGNFGGFHIQITPQEAAALLVAQPSPMVTQVLEEQEKWLEHIIRETGNEADSGAFARDMAGRALAALRAAIGKEPG